MLFFIIYQDFRVWVSSYPNYYLRLNVVVTRWEIVVPCITKNVEAFVMRDEGLHLYQVIVIPRLIRILYDTLANAGNSGKII